MHILHGHQTMCIQSCHTSNGPARLSRGVMANFVRSLHNCTDTKLTGRWQRASSWQPQVKLGTLQTSDKLNSQLSRLDTISERQLNKQTEDEVSLSRQSKQDCPTPEVVHVVLHLELGARFPTRPSCPDSCPLLLERPDSIALLLQMSLRLLAGPAGSSGCAWSGERCEYDTPGPTFDLQESSNPNRRVAT